MGSVPIFIWNPASRLEPLYDPEDARTLPVSLVGGGAGVGLIYPRGQVLGEVLATPGLYGMYNAAASDGTQNAKMILQYRCVATGAGVGVLSWVGGEQGIAYSPNSTPAYRSGDFDLSQLVGLSATALETMNGRLVEGALGIAEVDSIAQTGGTGTWDMTIPVTTIGAQAYGPVTVAAISATVTAAAFATAVNAALAAAGIPATVTATGGALGTNPIVATWHGALGQSSLVITVDNTNMTGGTVAVTRSTHGVAPYGVVRFG